MGLLLLALLSLCAGCATGKLKGFKSDVAPEVMVVSDADAGRLEGTPSTITILRKREIPARELVGALMLRAQKSGKHTLSHLQVQWISDLGPGTCYCEGRLIPRRVKDAYALEESAKRTTERDRQSAFQASALLHYRHNLGSGGGPVSSALRPPVHRPDLDFVIPGDGWVISLTEVRCKLGPKANSQITLRAHAH